MQRLYLPLWKKSAIRHEPKRGRRLHSGLAGRQRPSPAVIGNDPKYQQLKAANGRREVQVKADNMSIRPLYDRLLVKRIEEQETSRNGIVIPDSAQEKPQEGEVIATGRGKRLEDGQMVNLDVKVGDRILFGKYSGSETKVNGAEYLIMREDDVLGVLTGHANEAPART
jgi:chaperonin GroES